MQVFAMDLPVFSVLRDPEFLRGFGLFIAELAITSIIGGAFGVAAGALISRNEWLVKPVQCFLRLAMWMPLFILWGLMYWANRMVNIHNHSILALVVAASSPTILASCYYYLCLSSIAEVDKVRKRLQLVRAILFYALPICLLWQVSAAGRPWPWAWFSSYSPGVAWAVGILLGFIVLVINTLSFSTFERVALVRGRIIAIEIAGARASFVGMISFIGICLVLWVIFERSLKEMLFLSSPMDVLRAEYQLFVTGIQGMRVAFNGRTEWRDVGISLMEILGGIGLAGLVGFVVSKVLENAPSVPKTVSFHLLSLSYIMPIALWQAWFPWLGVGIWHKIALIACLTFFPVVQTLWIFRETPMLLRTTITIDEALPLAFLGMILGELWAATAGIGFFIVVSRAESNFAESTAMSVFAFALLLVISVTLRCVIRGSASQGELLAYVNRANRSGQ